MAPIINKYSLTILVDYSFLLYRSAFRFKDFSVINEQGKILTGALFGVLQFVELLESNYPEAQIILCTDGKPLERQKLFPGYKASRKSPDKLVPEEIQFAKALYNEPFRILGGLPNLSVVGHENREADDLIAKLAYLNSAAGRDVIIFTSDKDMSQLISSHICMSKEISDGQLCLLGEEYTITHKDLGVEPKYVPYFRPWKGDASDDIPGAVKAVLSDILREIAIGWYESGQNELTETIMEQIIEKASTKVKISDKTREKLLAGIPAANLNFRLMNLTRYKNEAIEGVELQELTYDVNVINYYSLEKYKAWREGRSIHAVSL